MFWLALFWVVVSALLIVGLIGRYTGLWPGTRDPGNVGWLVNVGLSAAIMFWPTPLPPSHVGCWRWFVAEYRSWRDDA